MKWRKLEHQEMKGKGHGFTMGKLLLQCFGLQENQSSKLTLNKKIENSIIETKTTRTTWTKRGEDSNLSLMCQTA